ncbi:DNA replication and repair protein RecF [Candidatus Saccharibacteria bacterium]|nr:DNA replication and repair protein RecF [Candidatus Saccharibacteria bacterium]
MQIVSSVRLKDFRSHSDFTLDLADDVTLIVGKNGTGKTSILEAIYLLCVGTSFKSTDRDMIKEGREELVAELKKTDGVIRRAVVKDKEKQFKVGEEKSKRLPAKHRYPVVLFEPDDLNLIHRSPSSRRDYFDRFFAGLDPNFARATGRYKKALQQRNRLLRSGFATRENLYAWDTILASYGAEILTKRAFGASSINQRLEAVYNTISDIPASIQLKYAGRVIEAQEYLSVLEANFTKDVAVGVTTFGPHRDDFVYLFNNKPADGTASRGENRTIIISQKFIEAEEQNDSQNLSPIILLDDVFSELDAKRQTALMSNFAGHQIIITSVAAPPRLKPLVDLSSV